MEKGKYINSIEPYGLCTVVVLLHISYVMVLDGEAFLEDRRIHNVAPSTFQIAHVGKTLNIRLFNVLDLVFK